jgi:hypothetical protein
MQSKVAITGHVGHLFAGHRNANVHERSHRLALNEAVQEPSDVLLSGRAVSE